MQQCSTVQIMEKFPFFALPRITSLTSRIKHIHIMHQAHTHHASRIKHIHMHQAHTHHASSALCRQGLIGLWELHFSLRFNVVFCVLSPVGQVQNQQAVVNPTPSSITLSQIIALLLAKKRGGQTSDCQDLGSRPCLDLSFWPESWIPGRG